ncbi:MAG: bifunctional diaminohydroxyphosphoribosylaminopyrimidine deaminase/5-amino-6-(5-phosphoribosylamino)uracil reductase RibD [Oceanospirillaceae bacterium]|nr:bifunctional diaminohydroxyphosphoribosylaminopyrimidine deaminase/5-amino-6-(5-phosphoribosylamino)uracil reductase RibD [Oceanospirillaceae bacterium]
MARAIQLAWKGLYTTDPNPRVGCVLVRDGQVIGEGYHVRAGEGHAEVNALAQAGDARGATAYVTLEPCSHYGRTPPCAKGLVDAGVTRVVAAMVDPNPEVAGRGLQILRDAGIAAESGLLEAQARELNPGFLSRMEKQRPFIRVKLAMSADGRTAMASGESKWITGSEARADVQQLRARSSAILTGLGSILLDDSALTVRPEELSAAVRAKIDKPAPLRVVLDTQLRMPSGARITDGSSPTLICHGPVSAQPVSSSELTYQQVPLNAQGLDLHWLVEYLAAERGVNELLVETGATLAGAFLQAGLVDELWVYMAPKLLGSNARPLLQLPFDTMAEAQALKLKDLRQFGDDVRFIWQTS